MRSAPSAPSKQSSPKAGPRRRSCALPRERESDLIVMGVHGRGALDLMVFGSNTHTVIRQAHCPVLTVRR